MHVNQDFKKSSSPSGTLTCWRRQKDWNRGKSSEPWFPLRLYSALWCCALL